MIRVLVVDDSAMVRKALTEELSQFSDFEVVGSAIDPYMARDKILELKPDVLTLDLEMPRMDGLTFLEKLMMHHPMPVVVVSSLTAARADMALRALELGAVAVVAKPSRYLAPDVRRDLVSALRAAATTHVQKRVLNGAVQAQAPAPLLLRTTHKILAIGASTGGTVAVEAMVKALPADAPGTVIVQHIPGGFSASFANRLNDVCAMEVREAKDGDRVVPGVILVAPGGWHMVLTKSGADYLVRIKDGPLVHYQKPAVDVLFQSVAKTAGANAIGVILTGMGSDGAKGLLAMRESGSLTISQDEATSLVFGMPKEAIALDAACEILPLNNIAGRVLKYVADTADTVPA
ncbi:MAG: chemotaxis response regulator protein-glutamate methylesterase [Elusimicrobia bacterium]|nr:chemotaxis response regulator protein-glutamate methylesterase [Elusimicrobiota bacterium]